MQAILLKENKQPTTINEKAKSVLDFCYKHIGCDCIEIVRPRRLPRPYVLVVDEDGLNKGLPINYIASYLYCTDKHGYPIVGTALLIKEEMTDEGPDIVSLTDQDIETVMNIISI